jgi:hypothetical protein
MSHTNVLQQPKEESENIMSDNNDNDNNSQDYEEILFVPQSLQKLGITRMARENQKFTILYEFANSTGNGTRDAAMVLFDVKPALSDSLEEFQKKAMKNPSLKLKQQLIQQTMVELAKDPY